MASFCSLELFIFSRDPFHDPIFPSDGESEHLGTRCSNGKGENDFIFAPTLSKIYLTVLSSDQSRFDPDELSSLDPQRRNSQYEHPTH